MPRTHQELNQRFFELGQWLGQQLARTYSQQSLAWVQVARNTLSPVASPHSDAQLWKLVREALQTGLRANFESGYRRVQKNTDENVSTSSVRELLAGLVDGLKQAHVGPLTLGLDTLCHVVSNLFEGLSRIRLATRFTGFQDRDTGVRMQHAAPQGVELFGANVSGDGSAPLHDELDRTRREQVLDAMTRVASAGASVSAVFQAGASAALAFTLNAMAAPASGRNQQLRNRADPAEVNLQMAWRELMKQLAAELGIPQLAGAQAWDAPWWSRLSAGQVSPRRSPSMQPTFAQPGYAPLGIARPSTAPLSSAPISAAALARARLSQQAMDDDAFTAAAREPSAPMLDRESAEAWDLFNYDFEGYLAMRTQAQVADEMASHSERLWDLINSDFKGYMASSSPVDSETEPWLNLSVPSAPPYDDLQDIQWPSVGGAMPLPQPTAPALDEHNADDLMELDFPVLPVPAYVPGVPVAAQAQGAGEDGDMMELAEFGF